MHVAFLTYGLTKHNGRLMPWRYVFEMAKGIVQTGNDATVITDTGRESVPMKEGSPAVEAVDGRFSLKNSRYRDCIVRTKPDAIYVPIARRSLIVQKISFPESIPHFGYFPSAWYTPKNTWSVCGDLPLRDACTYFFESLVPGSYFVNALKQRGFAGIVTVTEYTAKKLMENGWRESMIKVLPPGVSLFRQSDEAPKVFDRNLSKIDGREYVLFMGPPTAIRGFHFLLKAFDRVADELQDVILVCLLRQDADKTEGRKLEKTMKRLRHIDRMLLIREKLTEEDIVAFIKGSRVVALPFLIVPSEIPLAVIESMALNKPVIVTETGGTSEFIGKAGKRVRQNDIDGLSQSIKEVFLNQAVYQDMCQEAERIIRKQLSWSQLASSLVDFTSDTLAAFPAPASD